jgi:hypothetical protein
MLVVEAEEDTVIIMVVGVQAEEVREVQAMEHQELLG